MRSHSTAQRGSVVLVALCLTMILGIAVIGYVGVCARSMEMSNRSFCYTGSVQLAEIGLEEALWSLNQAWNYRSSYTWSGWTRTTVSGVPIATKDPPLGFTTNKGIVSTVTIQIDNYDYAGATTTLPVITSSGTLQMPDGIPLTRQLQVRVKPAALFSNAVGAYSSSSFTINWVCPLDSYETHVNLDPANPSQTRKDEAIVSAPGVSVNAANIFGYVATGGTDPAYTTGGTVKRASSTVPRDPSYILTNANQNLFEILPSANLPGPWAGNVSDSSATIGSPGVLKRYTASDLLLTGSHTLTIDGPVIIDVSGDFSISSTASIVITANGSAQIIAGGSITIRGNIDNTATRLPKNLAIFGKSSGSYSPINYYTAQLNTSAPFYGVIYVPYGSLQVYGTTSIYGALVAKVVDQGYGNGAIHYDLDLRKAVFSTLNTPYGIDQWLVSN